ncbi:hypothetical protein NDK25_07380 [Niallia taxi]|nr:hypothetical protein [Niallia taxi]MDE5052238.1 hypothetical protein [Niallia taxi]
MSHRPSSHRNVRTITASMVASTYLRAYYIIFQLRKQYGFSVQHFNQ